ncbi:MAG: hypothetical protein K8F60_04865 [Melioribacteraceae bacterium]|nr:hypothetical protein [Melioribacteraceae bacterium]
MNSTLDLFFPNHNIFNNDKKIISEEIKNIFTVGPYEPNVTVTDDKIIIDIDVPAIAKHKFDYEKVIKLCDSCKFDLAKPILTRLIKENPSVSEYHRVLGQIYSEEGNQDDAIDNLTEALRWNPNNTNALLMLGNIFGKYKKDSETAKRYYDLSLAADPDNYVTINNIGGTLLNSGNYKDAKTYLEMAYEINPNYPNTLYGLSLCEEQENNLLAAFNYSVQGLNKTKYNDPLYNELINNLDRVSDKYYNKFDGFALVKKYAAELECFDDTQIKFQVDNSLSVEAKIEVSGYHPREYHLVKYKDSSKFYAHLIIHELAHLDFIQQSRVSQNNKMLISTEVHKNLFKDNFKKSFDKLNSYGLSESSAANIINSLFSGINLQIYNAPIDLFIENYLFNKFEDFRPLQYASLKHLNELALKASTQKENNLFPLIIVEASTILNLVQSFLFKDLFGVNLVPLFNASKPLLKKAEKFYAQFNSRKEKPYPGEEYGFIDQWSKELGISDYFELIDEEKYKDENYLSDKLKEIEEDPFSQKNYPPSDAHQGPVDYSDPAGKMAVTMYCLDALRYIKNKSKEEIKEIGFEIAMLGTTGIDPNNSEKKLHLASIPNKEFTGLQLLAYMFVAWKEIDASKDLGLNFEKEYQTALKMI